MHPVIVIWFLFANNNDIEMEIPRCRVIVRAQSKTIWQPRLSEQNNKSCCGFEGSKIQFLREQFYFNLFSIFPHLFLRINLSGNNLKIFWLHKSFSVEEEECCDSWVAHVSRRISAPRWDTWNRPDCPGTRWKSKGEESRRSNAGRKHANCWWSAAEAAAAASPQNSLPSWAKTTWSSSSPRT